MTTQRFLDEIKQMYGDYLEYQRVRLYSTYNN